MCSLSWLECCSVASCLELEVPRDRQAVCIHIHVRTEVSTIGLCCLVWKALHISVQISFSLLRIVRTQPVTCADIR